MILEQLPKALGALQKSMAITVLPGEQNVRFALPHADRVYVLEHARIIWEGSAPRFEQEMGRAFLEAVPPRDPNAMPSGEAGVKARSRQARRERSRTDAQRALRVQVVARRENAIAEIHFSGQTETGRRAA